MSEPLTPRTKPDPVLLEILRCQFQGVVEEMGELLTRCGHTVFVKETQDFIVALVTPRGEVAACSVDVGIWLGVGQNFQAVIDAGGPYRPGDVWMTNDPEQSRGLVTHLLDVFCWRPIYHQGELVCFAAAFIHCTDVGGLAPGSIAPSAVDQLQEGVVIPVTRLVAEDEIREDIFRIFLRNSRIPDKNRGDVLAMLGALKRAELRVTGLAGKFGGDVLRTALHDVLDYAEAQARSLIREVPDGDYVFWDYLEGDLMPEGPPRPDTPHLEDSGGGDAPRLRGHGPAGGGGVQRPLLQHGRSLPPGHGSGQFHAERPPGHGVQLRAGPGPSR